MDLCPKCETLLMVRGGRYITENDDTPDKQTVIYYEQEKYCNNPNCDNYGKTVETKKHKMN